jgi:hypothetical protein
VKTLNVFPKERSIVSRERTRKAYNVLPYLSGTLHGWGGGELNSCGGSQAIWESKECAAVVLLCFTYNTTCCPTCEVGPLCC